MTRPLISITDAEYQMSLPEEDRHLATVTREMNDEEYAQYLIDKEAAESSAAEEAAKKAEQDAAKAAVEAKLAALGLDLETVKLIAKLG